MFRCVFFIANERVTLAGDFNAQVGEKSFYTFSILTRTYFHGTPRVTKTQITLLA